MTVKKTKQKYNIVLSDKETITEIVKEIVHPWCERVDKEIREFIEEYSKRIDENKEFQKEHAKQINGYLDALNKILEKKL